MSFLVATKVLNHQKNWRLHFYTDRLYSTRENRPRASRNRRPNGSEAIHTTRFDTDWSDLASLCLMGTCAEQSNIPILHSKLG